MDGMVEILPADEAVPETHAPNPAGSRTLLRNVAALSGSQAVMWLLASAWTVVVPRAIGPEGMGMLTTAWAIAGIAGVFVSLGTRYLLVRLIVTEPSSVAELVGTAVVQRIVLCVPGAALVAGYVRFMHFPTENALVIYVFTATIFLLLIIEPLQCGFQAIERMQYLAYSDLLSKAFVTAGGIALVWVGFGPLALILLGCSVAAAVAGLNVLWARRYFNIQLRTTRHRLASLLRHSLTYWTFSVFFMSYLWIDSVMLAAMTNPTEVGWYGVPTKIWGALMFAPVILSTALLPRLTAAFSQGPGRLQDEARPHVELLLIIALPVAVGVVLISAQLIPIMYTDRFAPSIPVMQVLGLSALPTYLNIMLNQVLIAADRAVSWTKVMAGAAIFNPILNFFLIRYFEGHSHNGALGAAVSLLITEVVMALVGLAVVPRVLTRGSISRLFRALLATLGMALTVVAARPWGLVPEVACGGAAFLLLALLLRVPSALEVAQVRAACARLPIPAWLRPLLGL